MTIHTLSATVLAQAIRTRRISCLEAVEACFEQIEQREQAVEAWQYLNPDQVIEQAITGDRTRATGTPLGPLQGIPVAIKDICATADMPPAGAPPSMPVSSSTTTRPW
ncbi:MAG: amidase family protein [Nodosilinea sp.]